MKYLITSIALLFTSLLFGYTVSDSIITNEIDTTICEGESFNGYRQAGTFVDTLTSIGGCDSIVTTILDFFPVTILNYSVCESDLPIDVDPDMEDENGCAVLVNIIVIQSPTSFLDVTICEGESFEGYTESGTFVDTISTANFCDSIRILNLRVIEVITTEEVVCDSDNPPGIFKVLIRSSLGCDSLLICQTIIEAQPDSFEEETICEGDTLAWRGELLTEDSLYTFVMQDSNGCDYKEYLTLNVLSAGDCSSSTEDFDENSSIILYPNPVQSEITIDMSLLLSGMKTIEIINASGASLIQEKVDARTVTYNVADFPIGTYLVKVIDKNQEFVVQKFMKN